LEVGHCIEYFQLQFCKPKLIEISRLTGGVELGGNVGGNTVQVEVAGFQFLGERRRPGLVVITAVFNEQVAFGSSNRVGPLCFVFLTKGLDF
jgi:hypothetical protein